MKRGQGSDPAQSDGLGTSIPEQFSRTVEHDPDRLAITGGPIVLTYGQLASLAAAFRQELSGRLSDSGARVALLAHHDGSGIAPALAVMQCRGVVASLNPADPPGRLAALCTEIGAELLICDDDYEELAGAIGYRHRRLIMRSQVGTEGPGWTGIDGPDPGDLVFLISTSGSTGQPKMVMQTHQNMLHNFQRYVRGLGIVDTDRIGWFAALSGGQGLVGAWGTLLSGATLCPYSIPERGLAQLTDWIADTRVTVLDMLPSLFRNYARVITDGRQMNVRALRLASEPALRSDFDVFRRYFPDTTTLVTVLGSSEAGIIAQQVFSTQDEPPEGRLGVGRPVDGIEIELVDVDGRPVPAGTTGELVVRSQYLSPGYWGDPELTAKHFAPREGTMELRTGDLANLDACSGLTLVARSDSQIKIRGHRLLLEEVEAVIGSFPEIQAVKVLAESAPRGDVRLTAYVVPRPGLNVTGSELRNAARNVLSPHAVPGRFVLLEEMPITPHGKLDADKLRSWANKDSQTRLSPGSETEELLTDLWSEAFEPYQPHPGESFLALGGDSLTAAVIAAGVREIFAVELDLAVFSSDPTVADLAEIIDGTRIHSERSLPPLSPAHRAESYPLSSAQARIWRDPLRIRAPSRWNVVVPFRIRGPLRVDVLWACIGDVVARHEVLRTTFSESNGTPRAHIQPPGRLDGTTELVSRARDPSIALARVLDEESGFEFDLQEGPLIRFRLLQSDSHDYWLVRNSHHLLADAASWITFFDDLRSLYLARVAGVSSPLQPPDLQYVDYVEWERSLPEREPERFQQAVEYWSELLTNQPPRVALPFASPTSAQPVPRSGRIEWGVPVSTSSLLDEVARSHGATYFMARLAACGAQVMHLAAVDEVMIGTAVSMRRMSHLQKMIGDFTNFGLLRLRMQPTDSYLDLLSGVRQRVIELSSHRDVPFPLLAPVLRQRGLELPQVSANFLSANPLPTIRFAEVEIEPLARPCPPTPLFRIGVNRTFEDHRCWVEFDPIAHDSQSVQRFVDQLGELLAAVARDPGRPLCNQFSDLPSKRVRAI